MQPVTLVLVVHDHQPVGNFEGVFEECHARCYEPFLAFLETHPTLRLGMHVSGPLLDWLRARHPDHVARLRALVERGQVEPWGGGRQEPILSVLPERDRVGQVRAMASLLDHALGARPRGLWLTERVWEPALASSLAQAGVEYLAMDDAHFVAAGLERDALSGWFRTEDQGRTLGVFPIHRELRYLVPFGEPEQVVEFLRGVASRGPGQLAFLGDDGEKFGVWPGTYQRCYVEGWLERFVATLAAHPWIELRTPSEAIARLPARGLCYLPTASYHEMQEWALPPAAQERYRRAAEVLTPAFGDVAHDLLRGGQWRQFLARYSEARRLHQRVVRTSRRLEDDPRRDSPAGLEARERIWRAQCNDAYWHGIFGGLYLPHLRSALHRERILADRLLAPETPALTVADLDGDGREDALLETQDWAAWVGSEGGALWGFDDRRGGCDYGDVLTRRVEAYHAKLATAHVGAGEGESIHSAVRAKEHGLETLLGEPDAQERRSFVASFTNGGGRHDWGTSTFALEARPGGVLACVAPHSDAPDLTLLYAVGEDGALEVTCLLESRHARLGRLTLELNLGLHVPDAEDRYAEINGSRAEPARWAAHARHEGVTRSAFVDRWAGRRIELWSDRKASLSRAPIETVSMSEAGAERVFQGLELRYTFAVALEPGKPWPLHLRLAAGAESA